MSPYGDDSIEPEGTEEVDGVEPGGEESDDGEGIEGAGKGIYLTTAMPCSREQRGLLTGKSKI